MPHNLACWAYPPAPGLLIDPHRFEILQILSVIVKVKLGIMSSTLYLNSIYTNNDIYENDDNNDRHDKIQAPSQTRTRTLAPVARACSENKAAHHSTTSSPIAIICNDDNNDDEDDGSNDNNSIANNSV